LFLIPHFTAFVNFFWFSKHTKSKKSQETGAPGKQCIRYAVEPQNRKLSYITRSYKE